MRKMDVVTLRYAGCSRGGVIVCSLFLGLLVACTRGIPGIGSGALEIGDGGFISGEPCGPPCFQDIIPGVTTEAEAMQILQTEGLCRKYTRYDHEAASGGRGIVCTSSDLEIAFQPGTDIVDAVGFRPSQTITVGDVIATYGEPDTVLVAGRTHYYRTSMILYYDSLKTDLSLPEQEGSRFEVALSTEVERILYSSTAGYMSYRPATDFLQEWKGYGEYREYLPPE
jgi:hypothetical protein